MSPVRSDQELLPRTEFVSKFQFLLGTLLRRPNVLKYLAECVFVVYARVILIYLGC